MLLSPNSRTKVVQGTLEFLQIHVAAASVAKGSREICSLIMGFNDLLGSLQASENASNASYIFWSLDLLSLPLPPGFDFWSKSLRPLEYADIA